MYLQMVIGWRSLAIVQTNCEYSDKIKKTCYNGLNMRTLFNTLVRKDMDVNEHERLSNFTLVDVPYLIIICTVKPGLWDR